MNEEKMKGQEKNDFFRSIIIATGAKKIIFVSKCWKLMCRKMGHEKA
jgi:hypothetical protein